MPAFASSPGESINGPPSSSLAANTNPNVTAKACLAKNPTALNGWLTGVNTVNGKPGLEAVKKYLGV